MTEAVDVLNVNVIYLFFLLHRKGMKLGDFCCIEHTHTHTKNNQGMILIC